MASASLRMQQDDTARPEPSKVLDCLQDLDYKVTKINNYGRRYTRWLGLRRDILLQFNPKTSRARKRVQYTSIRGVTLTDDTNRLVIYRRSETAALDTEDYWEFEFDHAALVAQQIEARMKLHRDVAHWEAGEQYIHGHSKRYRLDRQHLMNSPSMRLFRNWFSQYRFMVLDNMLLDQGKTPSHLTQHPSKDSGQLLSDRAYILQKLTGYSETQRVWLQVYYLLLEQQSESHQLMKRIIHLLKRVMKKCDLQKKYQSVMAQRQRKDQVDCQTLLYMNPGNESKRGLFHSPAPQTHLDRLLDRVDANFKDCSPANTNGARNKIVRGHESQRYSRRHLHHNVDVDSYVSQLATTKSSSHAVALQTAVLEKFLEGDTPTQEELSSAKMVNLIERGYTRRIVMNAGRRWSITGTLPFKEAASKHKHRRGAYAAARPRSVDFVSKTQHRPPDASSQKMVVNPISSSKRQVEDEAEDRPDITYGNRSKTPLDYFRDCVDKLHESVMENISKLEHLCVDLSVYNQDEGEANIHGFQEVGETVSSIAMRVCERLVYLPLYHDLNKCLEIGLEYSKEKEVMGALKRLKWFSQDGFLVAKELQSSEGWTAAVMELQRAEMESLPHDKLTWFLGCCRTIHVLHHMYTAKKGKKYVPLGADDFFPIFCYVIAQSRLSRPVLFQDLLWNVCDSHMLRGESGYYLTTYEAALQNFIEMNRKMP
eukprot:gb/GECG01005066.1/.p1 GENE.gb/GECG01005066.1/~~gb/GECG01005066.1/.p1  ORF type:complete len:709 (+),score=72.15 gb/GECG01005066.1/:1-2127(+)